MVIIVDPIQGLLRGILGDLIVAHMNQMHRAESLGQPS